MSNTPSTTAPIDLLLSVKHYPLTTLPHLSVLDGDYRDRLPDDFELIQIQLCVKEAAEQHTIDCPFIDLQLRAATTPLFHLSVTLL